MDEYLRLTPSPSGAVSERMQALLSRAVEEQVNEQRQVQSLLGEVRNALAEVQRDSRVAPGGQADLRADLANHASESRSQLALLDERLEAIVRAVGTSAQVLQGISVQLERVGELIRDQAAGGARTEPVAQVRREVSDLRTRVEGFESAIRADVGSLQQRLAVDVERLHGATEETARTIANHVDNAVLVLAEALLRRPASAPVEPSHEHVAVAEPDMETPAEAMAEAAAVTHPALGDAAEAAADDPLWGSSFNMPRRDLEEPAPGTSTWADETAGKHEAPESDVTDDEAGALVDDERADAGPAVGAYAPDTAEAYDDPVADLPTDDEPRAGLGLPAVEPYDLERALFGDRSRQADDDAAAAEPEAESSVDADRGDEQSEPETEHQESAELPEHAEHQEHAEHHEHAQHHEHAEHHENSDASDERTQDEESDERHSHEDGSEGPDAPRRRPWWRPTA